MPFAEILPTVRVYQKPSHGVRCPSSPIRNGEHLEEKIEVCGPSAVERQARMLGV